MAQDNVELSSGSGGAVIRTKAKGNVETPVSLIDVGDGSTEALVGTGGVCMPVSGSAASGTAASGNPVLVGGQYTNGVVTLDQDDVANLSLDIRRNLNTVIRDATTANDYGLKIESDGSILISGHHSENFDTQGGQTDTTTCFGLAVPSASGAVSVKASSVGSDLGLNVFPVGSHQENFTTDSNNAADNTIAFGIAVPSADGAEVVGGSATDGLLVDLGSNNDIKLRDGVGNEITSKQSGSQERHLHVSVGSGVSVYSDAGTWATGSSQHYLVGSVMIADSDWVDLTSKKTSPLRSDSKGSLYSTLRASSGSAITTQTATINSVTHEGIDVNILNTKDETTYTNNVSGSSTDVSGMNVAQIGAHISDFDTSQSDIRQAAAFGIAVPSSGGPLVIGGDADGLKVKATIAGGDVGIQGRSTGGLTSHRTVEYPTGSTAGSVTVASSACTAYSITAFNMTATPIFLKIYDSSTSASSTDTPILTYVVPANSQLSGAGFSLNVPQGIAFASGLSYRASTVLEDNDGGIAYPTSGDLVVNILYKA